MRKKDKMSNNLRSIKRGSQLEAAKGAVITVSLQDLITSQDSFSKLVGMDGIPARSAFQIARVLKAVGVELETFEAERKKLLDKKASLPEGTTEYKFETPEIRAEFEKEYSGLLKETVNLSCAPISIDQLGNILLSPIDLMKLSWLIIE